LNVRGINVLSSYNISWNCNSSDNLVVLGVNRVDNRIEGSSDFRRSDNLNSFSVLSNYRLYVVIANDLVSLNVEIFYCSFVCSFNRKSNGVSLQSLSIKFNQIRFFSDSHVKNSWLIINPLLNWSGVFLSKDLWLCCDPFDEDFWLSGLLSGDHSWFELDNFSLSLLLFLSSLFLPT